MLNLLQCYDDVVRAGDMVYYPMDYWHQTENLETPSVGCVGSSKMLNALIGISS